MPCMITHALTGILPAATLFPRNMPRRFWLIAAVLPTLPDLDVLSFGLGIEYGDFFGHRGFFHSFFFAALLALTIMLVDLRVIPRLSRRWWAVFFFFWAALASHDLLDAMTDGGLGIALFSPFDTERYFLPWTPIMVAPIGIADFFTPYGLKVLLSEMEYVWLPLIAICMAVWVVRRGLCGAGRQAERAG